MYHTFQILKLKNDSIIDTVKLKSSTLVIWNHPKDFLLEHGESKWYLVFPSIEEAEEAWENLRRQNSNITWNAFDKPEELENAYGVKNYSRDI